jgi:L-ascorbate metabolism protein UlaG (beta-lactamase superfamily)
VRIRLLRHATLLVEIAGRRILVDPMLGPAGAQPPIPETPSPRPNPLVGLPVPPEQAVGGISAAIVSHLHGDHIDPVAVQLMPRDVPVLCQPSAAAPLTARGLAAHAVEDRLVAGGIAVARTGGRHGTGAIGREMGEVSGFVLAAEGEPTLYVAGDTVWCEEVAAALSAHRPDVVVVNAGAARFLTGDPITMDVDDVASVCEAAPDALVVAVHMEAMNHCLLTRDGLRAGLAARGLDGRVLIPADGDTLELTPV